MGGVVERVIGVGLTVKEKTDVQAVQPVCGLARAAEVVGERWTAGGLVSRTEDPAATVYALSELGEAFRPALTALSLGGASTMTTPRRDEHATDRSLAVMLATTRTPNRVSPFMVEVHAGGAVGHAHVTRSGVTAHPGPAHHPDLTISGVGLRQALAHPNHLHDLIAQGLITADGKPEVLDRFARAFYAPLGTSLN